MPEGQPTAETEMNRPLADEVREIFERRARRGDRELIKQSYLTAFEKLVMTLPKENRDMVGIKIQRFLIKINAFFSEYGARISDLVRNVFVWPMINASNEFPNDKYYQMGLARAKAWGEFAMNTTKTATAERMNYRDHFLPAAMAGVPAGSVIGAVGLGAFEGAKYGTLAGGLAGAAVGAVAGAAVGGIVTGGSSLYFKIRDSLIGPPVVYYDLFTGSGPSVSINTVQKIPTAGAVVT